MLTSHFKILLILIVLGGACRSSVAEDRKADPDHGLQILLNKPFNPPWFDQETFDELWKSWPEPLRSQAAEAGAEERRQLAFDRYGLTTRPDDDSGNPLQFVVDDRGQWSVNCFSCHTGQVDGKVHFGVPNNSYAAETLFEDLIVTAQRLEKPLPPKNYAGAPIPLGSSDGVTNAFMITLVLLAERDANLNRLKNPNPIKLNHHDLDAPAWWRIKKRERLYADGFAKKSHRALMQMLLDSPHGQAHFQNNENDFRDVLAWLESLEAPEYPHAVQQKLADQGKVLFETHCSECHGTYGPNGRYPEKIIPLADVGTDPVRLQGVTRKHRELYERSWFAEYGKHKVTQPQGYLAPPLDGIWATAPYFHNGSVPTLWHVMHPDDRPAVWKKASQQFNKEQIGLQIQTFRSLPEGLLDNSERRKYYDTTQSAKSASGHTFPDVLTEKEKQAVLEYLKTL